jgi:hypothetical protein
VLASGHGVKALLVSPFNMKWGCYAWAGGWQSQSFASFRWIFPVRCSCSDSPRFYFRKHAFCFLPLATILESPSRRAFLLTTRYFKFCPSLALLPPSEQRRGVLHHHPALPYTAPGIRNGCLQSLSFWRYLYVEQKKYAVEPNQFFFLFIK